ncbi:MAG TPA: hypothetical protein VIK95_05405, partial [Egibacteraceae bacterium]
LAACAGVAGAADGAATAPATTAPPSPAASPRPTAPPGDAPPSGAPPASGAAGFSEPVRLGAFDVDAVPEASGLAASRRTPGVLYLLDDDTGTTSVLAIRSDGSTVATLVIAGFEALDGESLAVAPCGPGDPAPCLYIGDIGGNATARDTVTVWRVPEPDLAAGAPAEPLPAAAAALTYPDGTHDAETLLVTDDGSPFLVTKDAEAPPRLYGAEGFGDQTLADLGPVVLPEPALPLAAAVVGNVVTDGDLADGRVLLRTYDAVFAYDLAGGSLHDLPAVTPVEVPAPAEPQGEAIAWAADRCGYFSVSEGVGDIWFVACRP